MVATDTFAQYVRRMAATQGCPNIIIAETKHPIRQLDAAAMRVRAEAMLPAVIAGLTTPSAEIERAAREAADPRNAPGAVRSAAPI